MFIEFVLTAIGLLFIWDYLYKRERKAIMSRAKISGPKDYPILGSALSLRNLDTESYITNSIERREKYGRMQSFWILHHLMLVVADVKYMEAILRSQKLIKKSSLYTFMEGWLGTGLLLSTGKKWFTRRRIITPTFHFKILEQFVEVFDQQSDVLIEKLKAKADGRTPFDVFPFICLAALDIITETAMGVKVNAQSQPELDYVCALAECAQIMGTRFISPTQRTDWLFRLTSPAKYRRQQECIGLMHKFTNGVIQERRQKLQAVNAAGKSSEEETSDDVGTKRRMAFLDVLLQSSVEGVPLSNEDIREEVDTFMFEGHDTTTSGISFCLYEVSRHPEVQKQLIQEIHDVLGTDLKQPVSMQQLNELKYLECVVKEALRMYPSVPTIGRETTEDILVEDLLIPAKTLISLPFYMAMRDPEYYPEPEKFKPERFSNEENAAKINPFTYVPFSAGPRNCIGQKFAMLELKSTVSKILRHYELLPLGEAVRPMFNVTIRSKNGVQIGLRPRNQL
ncbi:cytochrome P450 4d2-like [Scaptodrosophila lebanonensis]|uniref:Cytochrome P450 4d2-like n=1 Tax=Drosophila lebanonensis TaxID=7225 RepID=A0A6J2TQX2_DROLE|nr:cytochrome P450 4d2-like [Scaptodrosophila lebanonensis]